ncbi:hypothetical protein RA307_09735 [Xanthobacteraceae bacterium Astr-EGSB]|uniref:hypothetical protein n=1 Tax=Astrobacterium formosum TaxID=3069710 RepID=UPI0027AF6D57|nr:hypothetical protein [Xanthobacteraceae bacterium Astr-EGSB]
MDGGRQAALSTRVDGLEKSVDDFRDGLIGLNKKVDHGFAEFGRELREAVATLTAQLGQQQKPQWVVLISAAGLIVTVLAMFGRQALDPVQSDLVRINGTIGGLVPREEFVAVRRRVEEGERRTYEEQRRAIERLEAENSTLRERVPR